MLSGNLQYSTNLFFFMYLLILLRKNIGFNFVLECKVTYIIVFYFEYLPELSMIQEITQKTRVWKIYTMQTVSSWSQFASKLAEPCSTSPWNRHDFTNCPLSAFSKDHFSIWFFRIGKCDVNIRQHLTIIIQNSSTHQHPLFNHCSFSKFNSHVK